LRIGPYEVSGYLHVVPGGDAVSNFRHRKPMVPLTDAWIEFEVAGVRERRLAGTLVVNRDQVDWVTETVTEEVEFPDIPAPAKWAPYQGLHLARPNSTDGHRA
jgi:hypothetical protein